MKLYSTLTKGIFLSFMAVLLLLSQISMASTINDLLSVYTEESGTQLNAEQGKQLWNKTYTYSKNGQKRSCTSCHGSDLTKNGKHQRTGKVIKPMAPSVNPLRFTKIKKVEKWFKRNCKWTLERECTAQEKGDILLFLSKQ